MDTSPKEIVAQLLLSAEDTGMRFAEAFLGVVPDPWDDLVYRSVIDILLAKVVEPILADKALNDPYLITSMQAAAFRGFEAKILAAITAQ